MGLIHYNKGTLGQSQMLARKGLDIAQELGYPAEIKIAADLLYNVYAKTQNYKEALSMYELKIQMRDSINNESTQKAAIKQNLQYEYEKKAATDSVAHAHENSINDALIGAQTAELKSKRNVQYGLFGGLLLIAVFAAFMYNRFKVAKKQKVLMEAKRKEANAQREIAAENKKLALEQQTLAEENSRTAELQTEEAEKQMREAKQIKNHLAERNKDITDSIEYAANIQAAILTSETYWDKMLDNYFILFKPKDIVSGDFYWAYQTPSGKKIWIAADCTGHGVPGGFMSMLGNSLLNEIIIENGVEKADEILDQLRLAIIKALSHDSAKDKGLEMRDGMDMAICILHEDGTLEYSGANNPLWILSSRNDVLDSEPMSNESGEVFLHEVKACKMPIGKYAELIPFKAHRILLHEGDTVYTFTDGYVDQFGGDKGKKFKSKPFKKLLLSIQGEKIMEQKRLLEDAFGVWKGDNEQVDDVCVIGVKI